MISRSLFAFETTGRRKWKYRVTLRYEQETPIRGHDARVERAGGTGEWLHLFASGLLVVGEGYRWDGATLAPDTPSFLRPSLVHDGFYQFFRKDLLPVDELRSSVDHFMRTMCLADHMSQAYAQTAWAAVRTFARPFARPWGPRG